MEGQPCDKVMQCVLFNDSNHRIQSLPVCVIKISLNNFAIKMKILEKKSV